MSGVNSVGGAPTNLMQAPSQSNFGEGLEIRKANTGSNTQAADPASAGKEQFGEVWKQLQARYGEKPEAKREIKKTLGKDDFLRIMVTQMKHQDPTNPFKAEQMATEIAQFTSVEQLQNLNQSLGKMATANQPLERLAMTNLIGKSVTVDRARFPHTEGRPEVINYTLPKEAASVKLVLTAENGEVVLEKDLGPQKSGDQTFAWDGNKLNTLPAKNGNYVYKIEARDDKDRFIQTETQAQARVVGISFEGTDPVFLVGDPTKPDKVTMRNIVRIDDASAPAVPGATPLAQALGQRPAGPADGKAAPAPAGPNFFSFQKGVGSVPVDAKTQAALQAQAQAAQAANELPAERGFPSGFSHGENTN